MVSTSYKALWKVKSKSAVLVLFLDYLVFTTFYLTCFAIYSYKLPWEDEAISKRVISIACIASATLLAASCPIGGWLADIFFGRYKVLQFGLWLMWTGILCINVAYTLLYVTEHCRCSYYLFTLGFSGFAMLSVGFVTYTVNAIQFGIDQMPDASSDELSAYIHWFVCAGFAGGSTAGLLYIVPNCLIPIYSGLIRSITIQLMISMTMLSLALCSEFILHRWLIIEPGCPNSLRMIYRVLKFAATHKYPIRRRAITYTEDEKPSRIDFAKEKFGGPFTTEQVEDVKTFFRLIVVLASTSAVYIPLLTLFEVLFIYPSSLNTCSYHIKELVYSTRMFAVELILLYSFIIHPILKTRLFFTLQRVVLAALISVLLAVSLLAIHALKPELLCFFSISCASRGYPLQVACGFVLAVELTLYLTAILEFACAQSPYHMRGLVMGILYSILFFMFVGVSSGWMLLKTKQVCSIIKCDLFYFLFQFLSAVFGLTVLCIVARWYKRRRREEEDDQRRIVEGIYDRILSNQTN